MEKQSQDSNVSQLSLDERFSENGHRSSARLRHQSLDRGMDRPSLNQRFGGGVGEQPPMTAPHCRWIQASSTDRQPLDQRFSGGNCRLSATGLHHLKTAVEQQDKGNRLQRPTTTTTSVGQQTSEPPVAALHSCTGHQTSSSHSTARQLTSATGPLMNRNYCRSTHRLAPNYGTRTRHAERKWN